VLGIFFFGLGAQQKIADTLWAPCTEKLWEPQPYPVTPPVCFLPLMQMECGTNTEQQEKNYISGKQTRKQKILNRVITGVRHI